MKAIIAVTTQSLTLMSMLLLTACSETNQAQSVTTPTASTMTMNTTSSVEPIELNLTSEPLNKQHFLGLVVPEAKAVAPCPFLSDETAISTAKTTWTLKRKESSNNQCYWSKNAGFSVKVTVEPLATAKPTKDRLYNLESPPILKPQPIPGDNAHILYDTTWGEERPFAISFEQNNQLVVVYVTGMSTNEKRLTATAKEVAEKLPIAVSTNTELKSTTAFNMCDTWSEVEIAAIIGSPITATAGNLDCKWEMSSGEELKQIRVTIYSGKSYPWDSLLEQRGVSEVNSVGERGLMERKRKRKNMPGHVLMNALYHEKLVTITTTDTIDNHESIALALSKNIDRRLE